jgi:hypothetical protein
LSKLTDLKLLLRNQPDQKGYSLSSGDLLARKNSKDPADFVTRWNPFEDTTPFNQVTEDHIFGAEFDKIRQEGELIDYFAIFYENTHFHSKQYSMYILNNKPSIVFFM